MRAIIIATTAGLVLGLGPGPAQAQGRLDLRAVAEQEILEVDSSGKEVVKRVPASKVVPGDEVIYTITARSLSDEPVENVQIDDPIPAHTTYVMGSVEGEDAVITFSVDGGKTFGRSDTLTRVDASGARRPAEAKDYTHVRWRFDEPLAPGGTRKVSFRARLD